jgi:hypothetical protein
MYNKLYQNAVTSLVTEPIFFEKGNSITEKTLMSIYSGHFIIWPGGYKIADTLKKIGMDVFDDIIDHSYQYIEHPGKRVIEAFLRNLNFLNDIALQKEQHHLCLDRLNKNLQLFRNIPELNARIENLQVGKIPLDLVKNKLKSVNINI